MRKRKKEKGRNTQLQEWKVAISTALLAIAALLQALLK